MCVPATVADILAPIKSRVEKVPTLQMDRFHHRVLGHHRNFEWSRSELCWSHCMSSIIGIVRRWLVSWVRTKMLIVRSIHTDILLA